MNLTFGAYVRKARVGLAKTGDGRSVRALAREIAVQPSYVSKVERDEVAPPSEDTIRRWAKALGEDPDVLLALAGKVSSDLRNVIIKRPQLFAELLRELKNAPDRAVLRVVREVRDGKW